MPLMRRPLDIIADYKITKDSNFFDFNLFHWYWSIQRKSSNDNSSGSDGKFFKTTEDASSHSGRRLRIKVIRVPELLSPQNFPFYILCRRRNVRAFCPPHGHNWNVPISSLTLFKFAVAAGGWNRSLSSIE